MPITIDLPLDKLQTYNGRNPRPADFDAFWDDGLAEVRALDPQVSLEPAEFQADYADCFDLYFTGTGLSELFSHQWLPDGHLPQNTTLTEPAS